MFRTCACLMQSVLTFGSIKLKLKVSSEMTEMAELLRLTIYFRRNRRGLPIAEIGYFPKRRKSPSFYDWIVCRHVNQHLKITKSAQSGCSLVSHTLVNVVLKIFPPFVSKLIIFYSQNTDSQTPFIITFNFILPKVNTDYMITMIFK